MLAQPTTPTLPRWGLESVATHSGGWPPPGHRPRPRPVCPLARRSVHVVRMTASEQRCFTRCPEQLRKLYSMNYKDKSNCRSGYLVVQQCTEAFRFSLSTAAHAACGGSAASHVSRRSFTSLGVSSWGLHAGGAAGQHHGQAVAPWQRHPTQHQPAPQASARPATQQQGCCPCAGHNGHPLTNAAQQGSQGGWQGYTPLGVGSLPPSMGGGALHCTAQESGRKGSQRSQPTHPASAASKHSKHSRQSHHSQQPHNPAAGPAAHPTVDVSASGGWIVALNLVCTSGHAPGVLQVGYDVGWGGVG